MDVPAEKKYYGAEGQKSIDPVVFMKHILIGYLENFGSERIMDTVRMRLDMLYFLGYDIDEELPWHSTISRTRQLYGEDIFKKLFRKVLSQGIDKGMAAGKRRSIDSAPVKAHASMNSLVQKEVLQDSEQYASSLSKTLILLSTTTMIMVAIKPSLHINTSRSSNITNGQAKAYKDQPGPRKKTKMECIRRSKTCQICLRRYTLFNDGSRGTSECETRQNLPTELLCTGVGRYRLPRHY